MAWPALLVTLGKSFLEGRQRKQELEAARHDRELKLTGDLSLEEIKSQRSRFESLKDTFKDEYVLALLSIPTILSFLGPEGAKRVEEGFAALSTTPDWYQWLIIAVFATASGIPLTNKVVGVVNKIRGIS